MRSTRAMALGVACLLGGWAAGAWPNWRGGEGGAGATSSRAGPTVEQVRALASLVTARVEVADVQETRLGGRTGGARAALLVKGDFLLGVDLSAAKFESVDAAARTAVLVLPPPAVASPRLDQERTRLFALAETGLWKVTPGEADAYAALVDRAYRDAQRLVERAAEDPVLPQRAREQAKRVIEAFFTATGWKVSVRWAD